MTATTTLLAAPTLVINPVGKSDSTQQGIFFFELKNAGMGKIPINAADAIVELKVMGKTVDKNKVFWIPNMDRLGGKVVIQNPPIAVPVGKHKVEAKFKLTDGTVVLDTKIVDFKK